MHHTSPIILDTKFKYVTNKETLRKNFAFKNQKISEKSHFLINWELFYKIPKLL